MPDDDDADCVEHVWVLRGVTLAGDGAYSEEQCQRCEAVRFTPPLPGP